jgi:hypothetical protein
MGEGTHRQKYQCKEADMYIQVDIYIYNIITIIFYQKSDVLK